MTSNHPKVSVIIPVYNAQPYLKRCLESVCNQTLKEIEIICVDDFSTDGSATILEEYSKKFPNLIIFRHQKNQGESAARNSGLALAQGEYLGFVDNDDEIDLNFFEKLYEAAKENNSDIAKARAIEIAYNGRKYLAPQIAPGSDKWLFTAYWWTAIFKRSMIKENNISFSTDHSLGGDLLFLSRAVMAAQNLHPIDGVHYHYHRREDSGDSKMLSEEKIKSALDVYEKIIDSLNSSRPTSSVVYNFVCHHFIMGCFYLALKNEEKKMKEICAKIIINLFEKCQDKTGLKITFSKTAPHLFSLLENNDIAGLEDNLINCKSRMELMASSLRARIKNNNFYE